MEDDEVLLASSDDEVLLAEGESEAMTEGNGPTQEGAGVNQGQQGSAGGWGHIELWAIVPCLLVCRRLMGALCDTWRVYTHILAVTLS